MKTSRKRVSSPDRRARGVPALERGLFYALAVFGGLALIGLVFALKGGADSFNVSIMFFARQDVWVLAAGFAFLLALRFRPDAFPPSSARAMSLSPRAVLAIAMLAALIAYAGSFAVMERYPLSIDEFWVLFDARAMSEGYLFAPVAREWRAYADALQPVFRLKVADGTYWASTYLPMNAALHAVFLRLGDAWLTGPVLAAACIVLVHAVARQIWPERRDAAFVAVLLLATSAQFLFTAMTVYAMTAHLALNLAWLWLYQRDTPAGHAGALATGFAATGLHQIVFHPLFAAPFIAGLWLRRRWRLAGAYTIGYAAMGVFWILYGALLRPGEGLEAGAEVAGFADRIRALLAGHESRAQMLNNFARLVAWQNPLIVILCAVALTQARRWREPLPELAAGIVITFAAVLLLMPFQGYGWGYRYLHGFLGSLALIAAYGWIALTRHEQARGRSVLAACTVFTIAVLPFQAWQANAFAHPYAKMQRAVQASDADVVILDPTDLWFGVHQVRNDPFLTKPRMMLINRLDKNELRALCAANRVAILDYDTVRPFGIRVADPRVPELHQPRVADMRRLMAETGCGAARIGDVP